MKKRRGSFLNSNLTESLLILDDLQCPKESKWQTIGGQKLLNVWMKIIPWFLEEASLILSSKNLTKIFKRTPKFKCTPWEIVLMSILVVRMTFLITRRWATRNPIRTGPQSTVSYLPTTIYRCKLNQGCFKTLKWKCSRNTITILFSTRKYYLNHLEIYFTNLVKWLYPLD